MWVAKTTLMRKSLLLYFAAFLCSLFTVSTAQSQMQKLYVHPKAPGNEKQSNFIDSIHFIPLQPKEGLAIADYNSIIITPGYFIIEDESRLFVYLKNGTFYKEISFKKLGDDFYPEYNAYQNKLVFFSHNKNYDLTPKDEIQIRLDWNNPRNKKYFKKYTIDLADPALAIKKETPQEYDINSAYHYYDDYFWRGDITTSPLYTDSLDYELKIYKDNQLVKGFFPYNRINESKYLFTEEETELSSTTTPFISLITRPFCDTVYKLIGDSITVAYQIVLPLENSLSPTFSSQRFKNKTERENFKRNNGWMFRQIYRFYESEKFILFSVGFNMNSEMFLYQKEKDKSYRVKNIKADSSQYNLSLLGGYNTIRRGDKFYKLQKAGELTTFFNQHPSVPVPKELESFLQAKPHSSAPVIVEFKLKN